MAEEDSLVKAVVDRIESCEKAQGSIQDEFGKFYQYWECIPDKPKGRESAKQKERKANTFVPEFHHNVETNTAIIMELLFGEMPFFELSPVNLSDPDDILKSFLTQALLEQQFEDIDIETIFEPIVRSITMNGTGVVSTPFTFDSHWEMSKDKQSGIELDDYVGPTLEEVPIDAWRPYPKGVDPRKLPWQAIVSRITIKELQAIIDDAEKLQKATNKDGKILEIDKDEIGEPPETDQSRIARAARTIQHWQELADDNNEVEIIDYWGEHPVKDDSPYVWRIVVVNRKELAVEIVNPYDHGEAPILVARRIPRKNSVYGQGDGHVIWRKQHEINEYRNLTRDMMIHQLYNNWFISGGMNQAETREFKLSPLKIWQLGPGEKMEPMRPPIEAISYALKMEEMDKQDARRSTSATDPAQGIPTGETLGEYRGMAGIAMKRHKRIATRIAREMLVPIIRRAIRLNMQFMDPKKGVQLVIFGKPVAVTPGMLLDNVRIKIKIASEVDFRAVMARRVTSALEVAAKIQQMSGKQYNLDPALAHLWKLLGMDPRSILPDIEKVGGQMDAMQRRDMNAQIMNQIAQERLQNLIKQSTGAQQAAMPIPMGAQ